MPIRNIATNTDLNMTLQDDYLTLSEVAALLDVTERTIMRWRARRIGPPRIRLGKRAYYRKAAVEAWLLAREQADVCAPGKGC